MYLPLEKLEKLNLVPFWPLFAWNTQNEAPLIFKLDETLTSSKNSKNFYKGFQRKNPDSRDKLTKGWRGFHPSLHLYFMGPINVATSKHVHLIKLHSYQVQSLGFFLNATWEGFILANLNLFFFFWLITFFTCKPSYYWKDRFFFRRVNIHAKASRLRDLPPLTIYLLLSL